MYYSFYLCNQPRYIRNGKNNTAFYFSKRNFCRLSNNADKAVFL
jgi:hypothetical protein